MFYGGESNVPGAPGNLLAGSPGYFMSEKEIENRLFRYGMDKTPLGDQLKQRMEEIRQRYPGAFTPQAAQPSMQPNGSSNLPGAVGNMGGIANAQFFEGPQLGQAGPQGVPQSPYGGAPNVPLTPEEKARLLQQGSPIPPNFREQYLPKPGVDLAANQGPSTPVKFDEQMNIFAPNMGAGRPGQVRLKTPQAGLPGGFQAKYVS